MTIGFAENAGKAVAKGLEFELGWSPTDRLSFGLSGSIARAELREDIDPVNGPLSGETLTHTPDYLISGSANYQWPVFNGATASIGANFTVRDGTISRLGHSQTPELVTADNYTLVDLRAGLDWGNYRLSLFANNILDNHTEYARDLVTNLFINRNPPRTIGLKAVASF